MTSLLGLPPSWESDIVRAYTVFGFISAQTRRALLDALTPEMRSMLAKRRRRDPEGQFAREARAVAAGPAPRASTAEDPEHRAAREFLEDVDAEKDEWEKGRLGTGEPRPDPDRTLFRRGNWGSAIMLHRLGASERPTVLSPDEWEAYEGEKVPVGQYGDASYLLHDGDGNPVISGDEVFWRGVRDSGVTGRTGPRIAEHLATAAPEDLYIGNGLFGSGTYVGDLPAALMAAGEKEWPAARSREAGPGRLFGDGWLTRFKFKPGTRFIPYGAIPGEIRRLGGDRLAAWVIANGYHGVDGTRGGDPYGGLNVMDRSRLVMERPALPAGPEEALAEEQAERAAQERFRRLFGGPRT